MESEVVAACSAVKDAIWTNNMLKTIEDFELPINVGVNNHAAIYFVNTYLNHTHAKHIDIRFYFIKNTSKLSQVRL
jgi:hypothetical protein